MNKSTYKESKKPMIKRKGMYLFCETCGKEFYVFPERLRRKVRVRYCSMKCYNKKGDNNPFWGKQHTEKSIKKMTEHPNHPKFGRGEDNPNFSRYGDNYIGNSKNWWVQHRDIISDKCQRCDFSEPILIVHHKDRNAKNNDKSNIEILCPNCHALEHFHAKDGTYHFKK